MSADTLDAEENTEYSPRGEYDRWQKEISAAKIWFRRFHKRGKQVNKAFLDEHKQDDEVLMVTVSRLNLFHANIVTLCAMLYGQVPKVEVGRRFADADDDVARVAGLMLTRILNNDIEVAGEDLASVYRSCLQDRLLPGLGTARLQYQFLADEDGVEHVEATVGPDTEKSMSSEEDNEEYDDSQQVITEEWVDIIYTHWEDQLWSPARTYPEVRWKAYRSYLTKKQIKKRFPKVDLRKVSFSQKGPLGKDKESLENVPEEAQAEVWEIWDKTNLCVYWWHEGYGEIWDHKEDPLELDGFWPDPPPLIANATTSKYLPKSDYDMAKDLYREVDELETRITMLTQACKLVGVYDQANKGIQRIFNEGVENQLIPVDNWAAFAEKGGLKGAVEWIPLADVASTIQILTQKQNDKIQQLYQVTGMNDVMRGAAQQEGTPVSATERKIQANYGSIRIEALQNEFARWVTDTQCIKAEIIGKHYQPQSIIQQSNIMESPDGQNQELVMAAVQLIQDPSRSKWKISVRPESLAIADYAQLKADRIEFIMGMAQFLQSAAPLVEQQPNSMPTLLKLFKWSMAGFKGSSEAEAILDQQIAQIEKQPPQQKPDPEAKKAQLEMQKMQGEMQMAKEEHTAKLRQDQLKFQMEMQQMQQEFILKMKEMQMELQMKQQEFQLEIAKLKATLGFQVKEQAISTEMKAVQQANEIQMKAEDREHEANVQMESGDAELARDRERAKLHPAGKPDGDAGSS
jgi:hypothetical protein